MAQRKKTDYQRHLSYPQALLKLNEQAKRIEELEDEVNCEWAFNLQQFMDCSMIALHQEFGFGPKRCRKFEEAVKKECVLWMSMCLKEVRETSQGKGNEDFWFTQGKMDDALRKAIGSDVLPWDQRYDPVRLFKLFREMRRYKPENLKDGEVK